MPKTMKSVVGRCLCVVGMLWAARADAATPAEPLSVPERTIVADGELADWRGVAFRPIVVAGVTRAEVALARDGTHLFAAWRVPDMSPLLNRGQDPLNHFHEGDAVELLLGPWREPGGGPQTGDLRLLLVPLEGGAQPKAVLYRQVDPTAKPEEQVEFQSPVRNVAMDSVHELAAVHAVFTPTPEGYICEASIPLKPLGLPNRTGLRLRGDMGVLFSNDGGMFTASRACLFDALATCVSDIPTEVELNPARWGELRFTAEP